MPFSTDVIQTNINTFYPNLEANFSHVFPQIQFSHIVEQLRYAVNQREIERGLHRIHCLLKEIENPTIDILQDLSGAKKEALMALTVIDACKGSPNLTPKDPTLPKDSVVLLFETLRRFPTIYPIFSAISVAAQNIIAHELFYLQERHVFYGEVPLEALEYLPSQSLECLQMLHAFWMVNFLGFDAPKKEWGVDQSREECGPAASPELIARFSAMQKVLDQVIRVKSLKPLVDFYYAGIPANVQQGFIFLTRLGMLLSGDSLTASNAEGCLDELTDNFSLIKRVAQAESDCYKQLQLLAVTFLPAVFWKIFTLNNEKSLTDSVSIFLKFQIAYFNALKGIDPTLLEGNRSVSLCALQDGKPEHDAFLKEFINNPSDAVSMTISLKGPFMVVECACVRPAPVLNPSGFQYAGPAVTQQLQSPPHFVERTISSR